VCFPFLFYYGSPIPPDFDTKNNNRIIQLN
jgi:hypothetical protein